MKQKRNTAAETSQTMRIILYYRFVSNSLLIWQKYTTQWAARVEYDYTYLNEEKIIE